MPIYLAARILLSDYCQGFLNEQKETKPFIYGNNKNYVVEKLVVFARSQAILHVSFLKSSVKVYILLIHPEFNI